MFVALIKGAVKTQSFENWVLTLRATKTRADSIVRPFVVNRNLELRPENALL
jgi:hypothetical protein